MAWPEGGPRQLALDLGHEPSLAADDFLVGTGNSVAHARIAAWPHWPEHLTVLVGPPASGKSHLARIFADISHAHMAGPDELAELVADPDRRALVIEDVDRGQYDEVALFHLLNQSLRGERSLLLTARGDIAQWPLKTDDARSRLRRAPLFRLESSDDIELSHMLVKLFGDRQIKVEPRVIGYLVARMERSQEAATALVDTMDRLALARGSAITRTIAAEALALRHDAADADRQEDWNDDE
ncbi:MAG: hypothetical protein KIT02_03885 [Devosia sp.]|uniref:hypothetical protein n=1 Tax=Devosia sp. TaxID=1871048 RepID=UPI0024C88321|nr:hypothetical protein [Devosia sp.]UYO00370.1 MAG: hypothetical protein KIT02_03885 [Devosia sp.]